MKKLFIKQRVFKITDHYPVLDENGDIVYQVDQDFKFIGNKVHVKDAFGREIFVIEREVFSLLPKYMITFENGLSVQIKSRLSFLKKTIDVEAEGISFLVEGDYFNHNFSVFQNQIMIGSVTQALFSLGDTFAITIYEEDKQDLILGIMIAIDCIKDNEQKRS